MIYSTLISPESLHVLLLNEKIQNKGNLVLLDASCSIANPEIGQQLYAKEHIPQAVFLDFDKYVTGKVSHGTGRHPLPDREEFRKNMEAFGVRPDRQIVIYDQGRLGFSSRLWYQLRWLGLEKVAVLDGGLAAWNQNHYPLSSQATLARGDGKIDADLPPLEQPAFMPLLQENLSTHEYLVVDARGADRFHGHNETVDHKAGHIPGSISRPGAECFGENGRYKSPIELRKEFEQLMGKLAPEKIINSCGSGVNASVNFLAMAYCGLHGSKLYPGSWSQWIDDEKNPIATD